MHIYFQISQKKNIFEKNDKLLLSTQCKGSRNLENKGISLSKVYNILPHCMPGDNVCDSVGHGLLSWILPMLYSGRSGVSKEDMKYSNSSAVFLDIE